MLALSGACGQSTYAVVPAVGRHCWNRSDIRPGGVSAVRKPPNRPLREARLRMPSPSGSGRSMSRQELADAVNAYLAPMDESEATLDANHIGKLERGAHRWPNDLRREAFRHVLEASTDSELGFHIIRGLPNVAPAEPPLTSEPPSQDRAVSLGILPGKITDVDGNVSDRGWAESAGGLHRTVDSMEVGSHSEHHAGYVDDDQDQPDVFDLWELNDVLRGSNVGSRGLALAETACARLDQRYAALSPHVVLPKVSVQLRMTVRALRESQPVAHRRRLCSLAGRLAGLRAWLLFDLADYQAADAWYDAAIQAAREAEDDALCGWLFGARSLIPSYRHDHRAAVILIGQGQSAASRSGDATVRTWLHALEARARAGVGETTGFRTAQRRADRLVSRTNSVRRRHGMDFDGDKLDLTYYAGTSHLLLRQPDAAAEFLQESLNILPAAHTKAQAILLLGMATAAAQKLRIEEASDLACQALTVASSQPIMPILQRAQDLRNQLASTKAGALAAVEERLEEFTDRLHVHHPEPQP
jgi:tetratricopeptide (TPR) repeat protein